LGGGVCSIPYHLGGGLVPVVDAEQARIAFATRWKWTYGRLLRSASRRQLVALVVLVRGLNVGGHRTFRPSRLAKQLQHLNAVNIGAAGTFVIRKPVSHAQLRVEVARRLPFDAEIMICEGGEIVRLMSHDFFAGHQVRPDIVRFVSVLSRLPRSAPRLPMTLPSGGRWLLKVLARDHRYVFGLYRRHMKVIGYLGTLDRLFGVPVTTRNWNTIAAIAKVLDNGAT
jgi:uncharacterized protein (DUF1697 family)